MYLSFVKYKFSSIKINFKIEKWFFYKIIANFFFKLLPKYSDFVNDGSGNFSSGAYQTIKNMNNFYISHQINSGEW